MTTRISSKAHILPTVSFPCLALKTVIIFPFINSPETISINTFGPHRCTRQYDDRKRFHRVDAIVGAGAFFFTWVMLFAFKLDSGPLVNPTYVVSFTVGIIVLVRCRHHLKNWLKGLGGGPIFEFLYGSLMGLLTGSVSLLMDYKAQPNLSITVGVVAFVIGGILLLSLTKRDRARKISQKNNV